MGKIKTKYVELTREIIHSTRGVDDIELFRFNAPVVITGWGTGTSATGVDFIVVHYKDIEDQESES